MRTRTKVNLLLLSMGLSTTLAVVGSTAATLAWYANTTMSKVSYVGTSVSKSGRFSLGLVDNEHRFTDEDLETYNCTRESGATVDGNTIIWSNSSLVFTDFLSAYLTKYGYAVNVLSPVTSNSRAADSDADITLCRAPETSQIDIYEEASKLSYLRFEFAFKIVNSDGTKADDEKIWLTDTTVETDTHPYARESLRLFVNNDHEKFIVKPTDTSDSIGSTTVCGMLDLDGSDGVYDYDKNTNKELVYGEYDKTGDFAPIYDMTHTYADDPEFNASQIYNVNNMESKFVDEGASTFLAKHNPACHPITNFAELQTRYKKAYHQTSTTIKPISTAGGYSGGKPIAYTDSASSIGYSTVTIYAEGWDHSLTDDIVGIPFNLGLTFETDRN